MYIPACNWHGWICFGRVYPDGCLPTGGVSAKGCTPPDREADTTVNPKAERVRIPPRWPLKRRIHFLMQCILGFFLIFWYWRYWAVQLHNVEYLLWASRLAIRGFPKLNLSRIELIELIELIWIIFLIVNINLCMTSKLSIIKIKCLIELVAIISYNFLLYLVKKHQYILFIMC